MARKTEVIITCNTQQAQQMLKQWRAALQQARADYNKLVKAGQGGSQQALDLKEKIKELSKNVSQNGVAVEKVNAVMKNLSGSTLRQLQAALREVKKQMLGKSEDSAGMDRLRMQYQQITEQIEKTKAGTIDVSRVMNNLKGTSLSKLQQAASQLEKEMSKLDRTTKAYSTKDAQLRRIREELERAKSGAVDVNRVLNNLKSASLTELKQAASQLEKEMSKLNRSMAAYGVKQAQLRRVREEIERTRTGVVNVDRVMKNLKGASLSQLKQAASQLEQEMSKLNRETKAYADKQEQLRQVRAELTKANSALNDHTSGWKKTMQAVSAYLGVTMMLSKAYSYLSKIVTLNLKFSDQLADIRKVSGLAMGDINDLAVRLSGIDTRTTIEELNQIAYAGAKLGIGKYGVEGLEGFTRAANQVNVALKEDLGEDALTALSKITEVMGLIPTMGVEKSMLATGSAMFQLSATSTATAGNIVEFAKRLTGMARSAGITTDQLLGLGSAADSMYLMPEVASTAFNKFISALQTNHNLIEKQLSIEPGTIGKLYEAGKIVDAMVLVFEKMKEKGNMNALKPIFKDLGSDGARLVNVMVTMSQNVDMLKTHLATSKEAFEEATAVTNEYNIQQETAQALMERASNLWEKAFVNPEGVDNVHSLAKAWYDVSKTLTESTAYVGLMRLALDLLLTVLKGIIFILPGIIMFFALKGAWAACMGLSTAWNVLTASINRATTAQVAFNTATKTNVLLALASVVVTAVVAIGSYISASRKATDANEDFSTSLSEVNNKIGRAESEAYRYKNAILAAAEGSNARTAAIKNFNDKFGKYLSHMLTEKSTALDVAKAYDEVTKALRRKMLLEQMQDDMKNHADVAFGWAVNKLDIYNNLAKNSATKSQYNNTWLKGQAEDMWNQNAPVESAIRMTLKALGVGTEVASAAIANAGKAVPKGYYETVSGQSVNSYNANGRAQQVYKPYNNEEQMAFAAANYIMQVYSWHNRERQVQQKYEPFKDELDSALVEDTPVDLGGLDNDAVDKDELKKLKQEENEKKRAMRESLKQSQDEAKAIIDNVKNYYERQLTEMMRIANEQNWDATLIESARDAILARENLALSEVRKGIVGVENNWETFKATMNKDMIETANDVGYNESKVLLDSIVGNNLTALHDKIAGLNASLGLPSGASFSAILKNATLNEKANETAAMRHNRERTKLRLEDDYTAKVNDQYSSSMTRLGYFDITEKQAQTLIAGGEAATGLLKKRGEEISSIFANARKNFAELLALTDPTSEEGLLSLEKILYGGEPDYTKLTLKPFLREAGADVALFYEQIIKYNNDYVAAVKQAEDRTKKIYDFMWERSNRKKTADTEERDNGLYARGILQHTDPAAYRKKEEYGLYGNLAIKQSFGVDPEVEGYRLKLEAARAYYDFILAHGASEAQLNEQRKAVIDAQNEYVAKLAANIKEQMDDMLSLTQPIQDFGLKAGDALATMAEDAEEGKNIMKQAVAEMINSLLKQTVQIAQDYIKRRIMQRVHDRLTAMEAKKHEADMTATQMQGEQTREVLHTTMQTGMKNIDEQVSAERLITQKTENAEALANDAATAPGEISLGIAKGSATTISRLGWWGIPLVAVITALLNMLLGAAMSKVSSALGGGKNNKTAGTTQSKLVSGMLTYDSGNVQSFRGVIDGKTYPVVGDDGEVYAARDGGRLATGLVRDPITTFVNGQPALVAERGPEMVIGRETTAALMMARPDIITEIVKFDRMRSGRTYRAFDEGNLDSINIRGDVSAEETAALRGVIQQLSMVLSAIQQKGIPATINKYGRGGIVDETRTGNTFMRRNAGVDARRK